MNTFNLRKQTRAATKPAAAEIKTEVRQGLPFAQSSILRTSQERRDFESLGLDPSAEVPREVTESIRRLRKQEEEIAQEELRRVIESGSVLSQPKPVDLASLPPKKQQEIRNAIEQAKSVDWDDVRKQEQQSLASLPASIRNSLLAAAGNSVSIVPTVDEEPATGTKPPKAMFTKEKSVEPAAAPPAEEPEPAKEQPTQADKAMFLAAITGGPPVQKSYRLLNGKLCFVFRQLRRHHDAMALQQARLVSRAEPDTMITKYMDYRNLLGLQAIIYGDDHLEISKIIDDYVSTIPTYEQLDNAFLEDILKQVQEQTPLGLESTWKMLYTASTRFTDLLAVMESKVDDENFWVGIER